MSERLIPANERNYGFWTEAEQERLHDSTVAIAGVGGDGFQLGYKLAMMGIGRLKVADPEPFEPENSNRVFGANSDNMNVNKAEAFKEMVGKLPRDTKVEVYTDGVTEDNINEFMDGADIMLDEAELRYQHIESMIGRKAAEYAIPHLMVLNIGFAGVGTAFAPDGSTPNFDDMMSIPKGMPLDEIKELEVRYDRAIPYVPSYVPYETFKSVVEHDASLPSVTQGVDQASAIGSTEVFLHLMQGKNSRRKPTWAKSWRYQDAYTNKGGLIRHPRANFYAGVGRLWLNEKLGRGPQASYSAQEIDARKSDRASL